MLTRSTTDRRRRSLVRPLAAAGLLAASAAAEKVTIRGPLGPIEVDLSHVGPAGDLVAPAAPQAPALGPPTIFSAPLPSGSGARALGFAGAFTAVADDATAASWNPAGLLHLERPEASAVLRYGVERNPHRSADANFRVGEDDFDSFGLNYVSLVWPFRAARRNWVASLNYQEAYDFTQKFTADLTSASRRALSESASETFQATTVQPYNDGVTDLEITSYLTTRATTHLRQWLSSQVLTSLEFEQEGLIDALSPALAAQISPKLSLGAALNFYQDDTLGQGRIRSRTAARYRGDSSSSASLQTERITTGTYRYEGVVHIPPAGGLPGFDIPVKPTTGVYPALTSVSQTQRSTALCAEGLYEEENEYDGLNGINATLGALHTVSKLLVLGATVDLPWTAQGRQTRRVANTLTTYDRSGSRVLNVARTAAEETADIEFHFPLYWALGSLWRWHNRFYTTFDISQTQWSDFWYRVAGRGKINPLDGSAYDAGRIRDCWSVRTGLEWLWVLSWTEIPLRAGLSWEQRPALGDPDEYWGASLGSGISLGKDPGRIIFDAAYLYTWGNDVMGSLVPGQAGLSTDVRKHQFFVSCVRHF